MSAEEWIAFLGLVFLLGVMGQLARVVVGLKKRSDKLKEDLNDSPFSWNKLNMSLLWGGVAGFLTGFATWDAATQLLDREYILTILAAGYAGSDLIDGLVGRFFGAAKPAVPDGH